MFPLLKTHRGQVLLLLLPLLPLIAACSLKLDQPEGPPAHSPEGLWVYNEKGYLNILRVSCGERCWFRDTVLFYRELPLSGKVFQQTQRSGYLKTSATEVLLVQTEFRNERISWHDASAPLVQLDRVVHGETPFRLLHWVDKQILEDEDGRFERSCPGDCRQPAALVASMSGAPMKIIISPDAAVLNSADYSWPAGLKPPFSTGLFGFLKTEQPDGPYALLLKNPINLSRFYESHISLTPGAAALKVSEDRKSAAELERQKRREEIRRRIKAGEPVSKEEMLEVLE